MPCKAGKISLDYPPFQFYHMSNTTAKPSPEIIVKRRVNINFDATPFDTWYPSRPMTEEFLNAISFFFPPGEAFFINSVKHYQHGITDPLLREQVQRFIYQEAMHTKEHSRCNHFLARTYPNGARIERICKRFLNLVKIFTPKIWQLAVTSAIEHFTAILADSLLRSQDYFISQAQPAFAQLWMWHAVEETEHKAVCFDVYQQVAGKGPIAYFNRALAMIVTTLIFTISVVIGMFFIKINRRRSSGKARLKDNVPRKNLKINQRSTLALLISLVPWRLYFDYFRPSFHPWDHNNSHLIDKWKQRFPEFGSP